MMLEGNGGPGVAHYIRGERPRRAYHHGEMAQGVVVLAQTAAILPVERLSFASRQYREHIFGVGDRIAFRYLKHRRKDDHGNGLSRLAAGIADEAVPHLVLLEMGDVNERHPHGIEAEHEDVTGEGERRPFGQEQRADAAYLLLGDAPLGCPGPPSEHLVERSSATAV